MGAQFTLAAGGDRITVDLSAYENRVPNNEDDANWVDSIVQVRVGTFSGAFRAALTTYELADLHEQLQKALASLSGTVNFKSMEEDLSFTVRFDRRGGACLTGIAQPHRSRQGALHFRLETDQSALTQTLHELEAALRSFPVRAFRT
jgi:hypothetical protein